MFPSPEKHVQNIDSDLLQTLALRMSLIKKLQNKNIINQLD